MEQRVITVAAAAILFGFGATAALAGPCTQQITQLEKKMSRKDAGSGPVSSGANTTGQSGGAVASSTNEVGTKEGPKTDATHAMNEATSQTAASAQDVRSQQQGQPTAAQAAGKTAGAMDERMMQAEAALSQARQLDSQNKQECKTEVMKAEKLMGGG
jgi:hypothetical protein